MSTDKADKGGAMQLQGSMLIITGRVGKVMKESVEIAYSYAKDYLMQ